MSEHTPTTEQVRNVYAYIGQGFAPSARKSRAQAEAEFDRWLDGVLAAALAEGFDHAVSIIQYDDGTPVEVVRVVNPFRDAQ